MAGKTLLYELPSIVVPLDPARLFPIDQPTEIELGSGDGSFLVNYAAAHPGRNFIGVERLLGRIQKMSRKAIRAGLSNLIGIRIESSYFLEYLLPPKSVSALHVYFPDPWPKRKHREKRLINGRFPEMAARVLAQCGTVYLRTDDSDYFAQMLDVFKESPLFRAIDPPNELKTVVTDFECDFNASGLPTLHSAYEAV